MNQLSKIVFSIVLIGMLAPGVHAANPKWTDTPKKIAGLVIGTFVGMPICAVRQTIKDEKYGVENIINGNHEARVVVPASVLWFPFAATAGVFETPWIAFGNSYLNYNKPFSKGQFSIIDTPEQTPQTSPPTSPSSKNPNENNYR